MEPSAPNCQEVRESLAGGEDLTPFQSQHLEHCPVCQGASRRYASLRQSLMAVDPLPLASTDRRVSSLARRPRRLRLLWPAAAAALLAWAGLLVHEGREANHPAPAAQPAASGGYPRTLDASGTTTVVDAARGTSLVAEAGTLARVLSADQVAFTQGRLLVQTRRQEPLRVSTPFGECAATEALFELVCKGPRPASAAERLLRSAWADQAGLRGELLVVRGSVTFTAGGGALQVAEGRLLRLGEEKPLSPTPLDQAAIASRLAWRDGSAPWQDLWPGDLHGWTVTGEGRVEKTREGLKISIPKDTTQRLERPLLSGPRLVWSVTLKRLGGGYIDMRLPWSSPGSDVLRLGELPQLGDGKEHTLTLRWDIAPELLLDGTVLREFPYQPASPDAKVGLGVTNGTVVISHWKWRALP